MSRIDHVRVQVLLLEMQPPMVASVRTVPAESLKRAGSVVGRLARSLRLPVMISAVPLGPSPPELIGELAPLRPAVRQTVTPFGDPTQRAWLAASNRKVLAIGGISSEIAVANTVLDARREGYEVHVLLDCCGGLSERSEASALRQMEGAGAIPSNVSTFFTSLIDDMTAADGTAVFGELARYWGWDTADRPKDD